jgi:hypothetical protein
VSQVRESAARLVRFAKETGTSVFLVGHVTKEGGIAGPRVLEHMVDAVLYFEGESGSRFRLLRAFKNRFGAVNELGVFAMSDKGLKEVANPSAIFLSGSGAPTPGSVVMVTREGTRPLLVEVQALVDQSPLANPAPRHARAWNRTGWRCCWPVLHRHGGVGVFDQDVFVNVVGGIRVQETAADLPVLLAVLSPCATARRRPRPWPSAKWACPARSGRCPTAKSAEGSGDARLPPRDRAEGECAAQRPLRRAGSARRRAPVRRPRSALGLFRQRGGKGLRLRRRILEMHVDRDVGRDALDFVDAVFEVARAVRHHHVEVTGAQLRARAAVDVAATRRRCVRSPITLAMRFCCSQATRSSAGRAVLRSGQHQHRSLPFAVPWIVARSASRRTRCRQRLALPDSRRSQAGVDHARGSAAHRFWRSSAQSPPRPTRCRRRCR